MARHYIRCLQDHAVPIAGQDHMIRAVDDSSIGSRTIIHTLDSSHSPFLSQPDKLASILIRVHAQCAAQLGASSVGTGT